ncbi:MAG: hypothetical protein Q9162_001296 [Coniocarpon cinnabarinum]
MALLDDPTFPPSKSHHVGDPPVKFRNPWPSFQEHSVYDVFRTRFSNKRTFVPVPEDRSELVQVRTADWGKSVDAEGSKLKATWIGHASWLIETPRAQRTAEQKDNVIAEDLSEVGNGQQRADAASTDSRTDQQHIGLEEVSSQENGNFMSSSPARGIRILLDPVFSERTSPFSFIGPKRYTPAPCKVSDLPEVDLVCISHNHYDHLDESTIRELASRSPRTHFLCALGVKEFFTSVGVGADRVTECDWWQAIECSIKNVGTLRLVCTPAQHISARWINDTCKTLWCSWALGSLEERSQGAMDNVSGDTAEVTTRACELPQETNDASSSFLQSPRLYFAGDTGYRAVPVAEPTLEEAERYPHCPAFATIGSLLGPFDLALLPVGLYKPRDFMSSVHCCPEDSVCVAKDVKAKKSIGMHYGTVRGGLSGQYEGQSPSRSRTMVKKAC